MIFNTLSEAVQYVWSALGWDLTGEKGMANLVLCKQHVMPQPLGTELSDSDFQTICKNVWEDVCPNVPFPGCKKSS